MSEHVYTIANKKAGKRNALSADLLEDGIAIATVRRTGGFRRHSGPPQFSATFHTDGSRARFRDFCDSLSVNEALEAMVGYA